MKKVKLEGKLNLKKQTISQLNATKITGGQATSDQRTVCSINHTEYIGCKSYGCIDPSWSCGGTCA